MIASDVAIHEAALTSLEADRETNVAQLEAEIAVLERERASYVRKKLPKWITVFEPTHAKVRKGLPNFSNSSLFFARSHAPTEHSDNLILGVLLEHVHRSYAVGASPNRRGV